MDQSEQADWPYTDSNVDQFEQADSIDIALDMNQPEQTKSTEIAIVSTNADITLVVGPNKKQIRVQSAVLKETSKPFAAMLSDTWKDPNTTTIHLPDDHADAMLEICIALHQHYDQLSRELPPATVLEIAIIADKYLIVETLSCMVNRYWLSSDIPGEVPRTVKAHGLVGMLQYTVAAWIFDDAEAFRCHTLNLVYEWDKSYIFDEGTRLDTFMDPTLLVALEEQRSKIKFRLMQMPYDDLPNPRCSVYCSWGAFHALCCLHALQADQDFPRIPHLSISDILEVYNVVRYTQYIPSHIRPGNVCTGEECRAMHSEHTWHQDFRTRLDDLVEESGGLCLFCCKLGIWTRNCVHKRRRPKGDRRYFLQEPLTADLRPAW